MQSSNSTRGNVVVRSGSGRPSSSRSSNSNNSSGSASPPPRTSSSSHSAPMQSTLRPIALHAPSAPYLDSPSILHYYQQCQLLERKLAARDDEIGHMQSVLVTKDSIIQSFTSKINYIELENRKLFDERKHQYGIATKMTKQLETKIQELETVIAQKDQDISKLQQQYGSIEKINIETNTRAQTLIQGNIDLEDKVRRMDNVIKTLNTQHFQITKVNATVQKQLRQAREELEESRKLVEEKDAELSRVTTEALQAELEKSRGEEKRLTEANQALTAKAGKLDNDLKALLEAVKSSKLGATVSQTEKDSQAARDKETEQQMLKLRQAIKNLKKLISDKSQEVEKHQRRNKGMERVLNETNMEIQKITEEKLQLQKSLHEKDSVVKGLKEDYFKTSASNTAIHDELGKLSDRAISLTREKNGAIGKLKEKDEEISKVKMELAAKEVEVTRLRKVTMTKDHEIWNLKEKQESKLRDVEAEANGMRNQIQELRGELGKQLNIIKEQQSILQKHSQESGRLNDAVTAKTMMAEEQTAKATKQDEEMTKMTSMLEENQEQIAELNRKLSELAENHLQEGLQCVKVAPSGDVKKFREKMKVISGKVISLQKKLEDNFKLMENYHELLEKEREAMSALQKEYDDVKLELEKSQDDLKSKAEEIADLTDQKEKIEEELRQQEDGIVQILQSRIESVEFTVSETDDDVEKATVGTQTCVEINDQEAQTDEVTSENVPVVTVEACMETDEKDLIDAETQVDAEQQVEASTQVALKQQVEVGTQVKAVEMVEVGNEIEREPTVAVAAIRNLVDVSTQFEVEETVDEGTQVEMESLLYNMTQVEKKLLTKIVPNSGVEINQDKEKSEEREENNNEKALAVVEPDACDIVDLTLSDNEVERDADKENLIITEKRREDENGGEVVQITISDKSKTFEEHIELQSRPSSVSQNGWQSLQPMKTEEDISHSPKDDEATPADLHSPEDGTTEESSGISPSFSNQRLKYNVQVDENETIILVIQGGRYSQRQPKLGPVGSHDRIKRALPSSKQISGDSTSTSQQTEQVDRTEANQVQQTLQTNTDLLSSSTPNVSNRGRRKRVLRGYRQEDVYDYPGLITKREYSRRLKLSYAEMCKRPKGKAGGDEDAVAVSQNEITTIPSVIEQAEQKRQEVGSRGSKRKLPAAKISKKKKRKRW